jgi:mannose-6-phosphate isomerase-like protein (cupin superfamily)
MAIEERPWGTFEVLLDKPDHKVKEIYVKPKHRFSLQYHEYREEHWTIVKGIGYITQHGHETVIRPGEYAHIPKKGVHRLEGGKDGITFIEVQRGDCREDDIIRLEDDYGRT